MDQLQFRLHLAEKLAIPLIESKAQIAVPRTSANQLTRLRGKHFPQKQPTRGRCRVCGNQKTSSGQRKDTKTNYFCPSCEVFLCVGECFMLTIQSIMCKGYSISCKNCVCSNCNTNACNNKVKTFFFKFRKLYHFRNYVISCFYGNQNAL